MAVWSSVQVSGTHGTQLVFERCDVDGSGRCDQSVDQRVDCGDDKSCSDVGVVNADVRVAPITGARLIRPAKRFRSAVQEAKFGPDKDIPDIPPHVGGRQRGTFRSARQ